MRAQRTTEPRALALFFVALAAASLTACQHVAPYERGRLAHPTMVSSDIAGVGEGHVRAVQEGAMGGGTGAESGCGCN